MNEEVLAHWWAVAPKTKLNLRCPNYLLPAMFLLSAFRIYN
jgi:hypothetical protein